MSREELDKLSKEELLDIITESVPKDKLKSESFLERIRWWYYDNPNIIKIVFWIILMLFSFVTGESISDLISSTNESFKEYEGLITWILGLLVGGSSGMLSSRNPKK
jgi:hypothetical protein